MSKTAWAIWREPGELTFYSIKGEIAALNPSTESISGFWVHPFEGKKGDVILGKAIEVDSLSDFILRQSFYSASFILQDDWDSYVERLENLIQELENGKAEKVVLSRRAHLDALPLSPNEASDVIKQVADAYPKAFVCLIGHPDYGVWLTATPEILCRRTNTGYYTMALAGTRSPSDTSPWQSKELREQGLVRQYIEVVLADLEVENLAVDGPAEVQAGALRHLRTDFTWNGGPSLREIAQRLHPTPAVAGLPLDASLDLIRDYESSERRLYAGYLGYVPTDGPATLYVNLRCATLTSPEITLWAGGGILSDSNPEAEWVETEEKLNVLRPFLST